jgi:hypothetical protein
MTAPEAFAKPQPTLDDGAPSRHALPGRSGRARGCQEFAFRKQEPSAPSFEDQLAAFKIEHGVQPRDELFVLRLQVLDR